MSAEQDDDLDGFVLRLAATISDGAGVDWERAEASASPDRKALLRSLRSMDRIAAAHRPQDGTGRLVSAPPLTDAPSDGTGNDWNRDPRPGTPQWGHLEILEKIGEGTFGEVYRAWDTRLDREVALKLLWAADSAGSDAYSEVIREGRLLAKVSHDNVARVYGADRHDGRVGIWMERIHGRTLEQLLQEHGRLGADEAMRIGQDVCRALAALHQAGVLHRDVKTANILRAEGGRIVLMDFGTGREAEAGSPGQEAGWDAVGTALYMAPEVLRGEPATARSDIYSLGVVLFRLVTGAFPVEGGDFAEVARAHDDGRRNWLADVRPDLPGAFVRVVGSALAPDPAKRHASAGQLYQALAAAQGGSLAETHANRGWKRFVGLVAVATALMVAVVAAVLLVRHAGTGASYEVAASLYRANGGRTELLLPGATIAPGDQLFLECTATKDLHVYVVSRDDNGETYLLFPMKTSETRNPLPAGATHRLPGTRGGVQLVWTVTSSGGREQLLVVASLERLDDFETEVLDLDQPREIQRKAGAAETTPAGEYGAVSEKTLARLRGIGGFARQPLTGTGGVDAFQKLAAHSEATRGTWMRRIDLEYAR